jgi:hypothetical protein
MVKSCRADVNFQARADVFLFDVASLDAKIRMKTHHTFHFAYLISATLALQGSRVQHVRERVSTPSDTAMATPDKLQS